METFVQHFLNASLQAGKQRPDVLHQNVIQCFGQVMQATVCSHAAVLRVRIKELELCSSSLAYVAVANDVLLAPIDNACRDIIPS